MEGDLAVSRGLGDFRFKDPDAVLSGAMGEVDVEDHVGGVADADVRRSRRRDAAMMRPRDQKVSPVPDIIVQNRDPNEDEFVVVACDGIWDVQTNQECVRMVADIFQEGETDIGLACEEVLDLCLIKGSKDNMTTTIIKCPKQTPGKGGGVAARRKLRGGPSPSSSSPRNTGGVNVYNPHAEQLGQPQSPEEQ